MTKGLIIMTTYNTRDLANAIIGEDEVEANAKSATRTLRKFLRADANNEKALHTCPGKGGRYSIDLNKTQLKAMTKRFIAWQEQQEAEANARREARAAATKKVDEVKVDDEVTEGDSANEVEGPSDEEIAEMIADED